MPAKVRIEPRTFFKLKPNFLKLFLRLLLSTDRSTYFQFVTRSTNILPQNALIQLQHWSFNVMENLAELHSTFVT